MPVLLRDEDIYIWVSESGDDITQGERRWRSVRNLILSAGGIENYGKAVASLSTKLIEAQEFTLFCCCRGQKIGIGLGRTADMLQIINIIEDMLEPKVFSLIKARPPKERNRAISVLYYQRVALAQALGLKGVNGLWRVNPLFMKDDYRAIDENGDRLVGGFLLKALNFGRDDYTGILCCSPLTGKVVVHFL